VIKDYENRRQIDPFLGEDESGEGSIPARRKRNRNHVVFLGFKKDQKRKKKKSRPPPQGAEKRRSQKKVSTEKGNGGRGPERKIEERPIRRGNLLSREKRFRWGGKLARRKKNTKGG